MASTDPPRAPRGPHPATVVTGLLLIAAIAAVALQIGASSSSSSTSTAPSHSRDAGTAPSMAGSGSDVIGRSDLPRVGIAQGAVPGGALAPRADRRGRLGEADGALPAGVTVFDDQFPGVARLRADLLRALRDAATEATADGITLHVTSGWRSRAYQEQLLQQAVARYGSAAEAARWVATADTSPHVSGDAVDVGPADATAWLSKRGAGYGLCQIYLNEPWHYEYRPDAVDRGCPRMYADPPHDPRMQE